LLVSVAEKRFRQDLYYRLNVARFILPALRDRREDIPLLFQFFLEKYNRKMNARSHVGDGVVESLQQYDFPGNIRELENLVEQAVALSGGGVITLDDIGITPPAAVSPTQPAAGKALADVVDTAERVAIETALRECEGSRERAADALGISATTLWRKMTRLNITYP
jgi:two-component system, NtrC family, response regulator HydG